MPMNLDEVATSYERLTTVGAKEFASHLAMERVFFAAVDKAEEAKRRGDQREYFSYLDVTGKLALLWNVRKIDYDRRRLYF